MEERKGPGTISDLGNKEKVGYRGELAGLSGAALTLFLLAEFSLARWGLVVWDRAWNIAFIFNEPCPTSHLPQ